MADHYRVQMSDVSSVQTTSFHTRLSFLDEENDDILLEDGGDDDDDGYGEEYNICRPSGNYLLSKTVQQLCGTINLSCL